MPPKSDTTKHATSISPATMAANPMLKQFRAARNAGAPLIAIQTPDPRACMDAITVLLKDTDPAMLSWDTMRGFLAVNKKGEKQVGRLQPAKAIISMEGACEAAEKLEDSGIIFILNAHRFLDGPTHTANIQGVWNLRDQFKPNGRTLVLLAPSIILPPELANDTLVLDEALPDAGQLRAIAAECHVSAGWHDPSKPKPEKVDASKVWPTPEAFDKMVDAIAGLSAFPAEQAVAMSIRKSGVDMDALWERKRQMVEQTKGLQVYRGKGGFSDVAGLQNIKTFMGRVINGQRRPRVVVFIDEIEKAIGGGSGAPGEMNHVSTDQLGTILSFMEDNEADGTILIGPPGTGKSMLAKAMGNEGEVPTVMLDLGGMKGSYIGESEGAIRNALKVCKAIGGNQLYFIATCNSITALPPELRRRFTDGIFFMDLPDAEERNAAWQLYAEKYGLTGVVFPDSIGWTGAEIRNCCKQAWRLGIELDEAAQYIVPVAISAGPQIDALRDSATGKYLSASHAGLYRKPQGNEQPSAPVGKLPSGGGRQINVE